MRYTLLDFYPDKMNYERNTQPYTSPKSWGGHPFAAIKRAFRIVGDVGSRVPYDVQTKLLKLSKLYDRKLPRRTQHEVSIAVSRTRSDRSDHSGKTTSGHSDGPTYLDFDRHAKRTVRDGQSGQAYSEPPSDGRKYASQAKIHVDGIPLSIGSMPLIEPVSKRDSNLSQASMLVSEGAAFKKMTDDEIKLHSWDCRTRVSSSRCDRCAVEKCNLLLIEYPSRRDNLSSSSQDQLLDKHSWRFSPVLTSSQIIEKARVRPQRTPRMRVARSC